MSKSGKSKSKSKKFDTSEMVPIRSSSPPEDSNEVEEETFDLDLESSSGRGDAHSNAHDEFDPDGSALESDDAQSHRMMNDTGSGCKRMVKACMIICALVLAVLIPIILSRQHITPPTGSNPILSITKSKSDMRAYRYIQLKSNSLSVLLVNDNNTEKASAAMSVGTGSASDYPSYEGIAHFLEHMLFIGSKQFPEPDEYGKVVQALGGYYNAWTSEEETNFYVDIQAKNGSLASFIPRFAGFFVDPLLSASSVAKEMNAVMSEHQKNLLDDGWRQFALLHQMADVQSAFHHFGTGTIQTLNKTDIVDKLKQFWTEHYQATNMRLVLLGKETLDDLEVLATKHFSDVKGTKLVESTCSTSSEPEVDENTADGGGLSGQSHRSAEPLRRRLLQTADDVECDAPQPSYPSPFTQAGFNRNVPFTKAQTNVNVSWIPATSPSHSLNVYFPIDNTRAPLDPQFLVDPYGYISYLLNHEGSINTFCSYIKKSNWAESISAGVTLESKEVEQALFAVEIKLTELGNRWDNRQLVLKSLFEYIELIRNTPLINATNSHEEYYLNMQQESQVRFDYKEKETPREYTQALASRMTNYMVFNLPISNILFSPSIHDFMDGSPIQSALEYFTLENSIVMWSSSDLQDDTVASSVAPKSNWQIEPWYSISYYAQPISTEFAKTLTEALSSAKSNPASLGMSLPPVSNEFIPDSFDVINWDQLQFNAIQEAKVGNSTTARDALKAACGPFDLDTETPVLLPQPTGMESNLLYFKADERFGLPYTYFSSIIRVKDNYLRQLGDLAPQVKLQLYLNLLVEVLTPLQYQLAMVGYRLDVESDPARLGFIINLSGFSSKLPLIWKRVLPMLMDLSSITQDRFSAIRTMIKNSVYDAFETDHQPYELALYYLRLFEEGYKPSIGELKEEFTKLMADSVTIDTFSHDFVNELYSYVGITSYVYGNVKVDVAAAFQQDFYTQFKSSSRVLSLTAEDMVKIDLSNRRQVFQYISSDVTTIPTAFIFKHNVLAPQETNSAMILNLQISTVSNVAAKLRSCLILSLLNQMLSPAAFKQLRTDENLGYMVWTTLRDSSATVGPYIVRSFDLVIQSDKYDPLYLEQRAEAFLLQFESDILPNLSDDEFAQHVATLTYAIQQVQRSRLSMSTNFDSIWSSKILRSVDSDKFERETLQLSILPSITRSEVAEFYRQKFVAPLQRRKLAIAVFGNAFNSTMPIPSTDAKLLAISKQDIDLGSDIDVNRDAVRFNHWNYTGL